MLEHELDAEQLRHAEAVKQQKRFERKLKEIASQADDDKKNLFHMQEIVEKLQAKVKSYKKQAELAVSRLFASILKRTMLALSKRRSVTNFFHFFGVTNSG